MTEYLNDALDLNDLETASLVDEVSLWSARFGSLLLDHLEMSRDLRVLDVGFGNGFPLIELAQRYPSCRFAGIDVWTAGIHRAAIKRRTFGLANVSLLRGDGARLPFADDTFDRIVSNVGVNNFAQPEQAMAECGRVARPGAVISLTTNPRGHMAELYDAFRHVLRETGHASAIAKLDQEEAHRATLEGLTELLGTGGFRVERVVEDRFPLRYEDGSALLRHPLTRLGFLDGWRSVVPDDAQRDVFTALEEELNERSKRDGELRMHVPMLYVEARSG